MSSINPLGSKFNLTSSVTTAAIRVSLRDCSGVGFYVVGASAATPLSITEANAASGGTSQALPGLATLPFWTQAAGTSVWTVGTGAPTTIANAAAALYCFVPQGMLSDSFTHLAASHATGTMVYLLADLDAGRKITNLANPRL